MNPFIAKHRSRIRLCTFEFAYDTWTDANASFKAVISLKVIYMNWFANKFQLKLF